MSWIFKTPDSFKKGLLSLRYGISPITASILINRGIEREEDVEIFLFPTLDKLYDPYIMPGVKEGVERLKRALVNGEKILVYGDYDVDGVTGTALLLLVLREAFGNRISYFIPHRVKEGYGLHSEIIRYARDKGFSLVITVDCGIGSVDVVSEGLRMGIDFIITDHHIPGERLPEGAIIINPKLKGSRYPFKDLAGVGVAWKFLSAFVGKPLVEFLDLVALGTVADMVPLLGENRILVKEGFKLLERVIRPGIRELLKEAGIKPSRKIDEWLISFIMAPRLNAAGRMDIADLSVNLLLTPSFLKARELSKRLNILNSKRKSIEERMLNDVEGRIEDLPIIFLYDEKWHLGVLGIVASKLVEKYGKPAFLMCKGGGKVKGSARGIEGFRIDEALSYCSEVLDSYGGHELAGGFSLKEEKIFDFKEKLLDFSKGKAFPLVEWRWIDGKLEGKDLTSSLAQEISNLSPWGKGNPQPLFVLENVILQSNGLNGNRSFKGIKDGIVFDVFSPKGDLPFWVGKKVTLLGFWCLDSWAGTPCFKVENLFNGGDWS
ncbi:MAG: single-stranded-DNA-specific exonuclease RecJ [Synergistetes bacterium]|nr:single-stranded-DNA-specific exonuclease RecJ [Synergistota bacterium]MCX8127141.1 single-stranded-DNA-specific exonuclease RecJ [Synergistota bacterium]MDW8191973.1 single-stranded-DNA-specific exonuclease RecJ [Synergistota bacterium]